MSTEQILPSPSASPNFIVPQADTAVLASTPTDFLNTPLAKILGARSANKLTKLKLHTVGDLIAHIPFRLAKRGELLPIEQVQVGDSVTVVARVLSHSLRAMQARRGYILSVHIADGAHDLELTFFAKSAQPLKFHQSRLTVGQVATFSGTVSSYRGQLQLTHPDYELLEDENAVDPAKVNAPIPIYHAAEKIPSWHIAKAIALVLPLLKAEHLPEILPADFIAKHQLLSRHEALLALHQPDTESKWREAYQRYKYEEAFLLQLVLAKRLAQAQAETAPKANKTNGELRDKFCAELPFRFTDGQKAVIDEIAQDLSQSVPMRRLLQGDVGAGKTVVAVMAMLQMIEAGKQAILLAPTEVLARQHYESITRLLADLIAAGKIRVALLTGKLTPREHKQILLDMACGKAQLVIGTHALLQDNVQLPFLGLVVVDEQHRFGVEQRDRHARGVHLLVMTATPIPRTIAMTIFGDLQVSTLQELPAGRQAIETILVEQWLENWMKRVWERAAEEVAKGGRVYVVCPRITDSQEQSAHSLLESANQFELEDDAFYKDTLFADLETADSERSWAAVESTFAYLQTVPALKDIQLAKLHGRLSSAEKTAIMQNFSSGQTPILVSTTVIEVGVDVPEATLMIILDADRFGLSQLHQLRGRVGRGKNPSLCLAVHGAPRGSLALARLEVFASTTNGFELAQADLELRKAGNILGIEQSGARSNLKFLDLRKDEDVIVEAKIGVAAWLQQGVEAEKEARLWQAVQTIYQEEETEFLVKF